MRHLIRLRQLGQSYWLDNAASVAELQPEAVEEAIELGFEGVAGCSLITSQSLEEGERYHAAILEIVEGRRQIDAVGLYEGLAFQEYRTLADLWLDACVPAGGSGGLLAVPVTPLNLNDANRFRLDARRVWRGLNRLNVLVKTVATTAVVEAVPELIADGISLFICDLKCRERMEQILDAYRAGLEKRAANDLPLHNVHCVAGMNVAGIDATVDHLLDAAIEEETGLERKLALQQLKGRAAIATARLAAAAVTQRTRGAQWNMLQRLSARPMRIAWEGMRDTEFCDGATYFENLIGPDTICCLPKRDLARISVDADAAVSLYQGYSQAQTLLADLAGMGLDVRRRMRVEEQERAQEVETEFLNLLETIAERRASPSLSR